MSARYFRRKNSEDIDNISWKIVCNNLGVDPWGIFKGKVKGLISLELWSDEKKLGPVFIKKEDLDKFCKKWNLPEYDLNLDINTKEHYIGFKHWNLSCFNELDDVGIMVMEAVNKKDGKKRKR